MILETQGSPRVSRYPEAELAADRAIHVVAILVGAVGALAMVARALVFANARTFSAVVVYTLALLAMLCASAAHNCGPTRAGKDLRRRVDHAAIFDHDRGHLHTVHLGWALEL